MSITYLTLNSSDVTDLKDHITYRTVNTMIAVGCILSNFVILFVFLSYQPFRTKYVLLIQLAIGDMLYSIASVYIGIEEIWIYSTAISTLQIPLKTTMDCLLNMGLQLKFVGDILIPVTILWMGLERFTAITFPFFYRMSVDQRLKCIIVPLLSGIIVIAFLVCGIVNVLNSNRLSGYNCGRKTTFGVTFSSFIYLTNIFCSIASSTLNAIAYLAARITMKKNPGQAQNQVDTIRYYLLISLLSTILVSVPSMRSLYNVYVGKVTTTLSKTLEWMQTLNSGINVFVYLLLNKEFRRRIIQLLQKGRSTRIGLTVADHGKPQRVAAISSGKCRINCMS